MIESFHGSNIQLKEQQLSSLKQECNNPKVTKFIEDIFDGLRKTDRQNIKDYFTTQLVTIFDEISSDNEHQNFNAIFIEHDLWSQEAELYFYNGSGFKLCDGNEYLEYEDIGDEVEIKLESNSLQYQELWQLIDEDELSEFESSNCPDSGLFTYTKEYLAAFTFDVLREILADLEPTSESSNYIGTVFIYANEHDMEPISLNEPKTNK